MINRSKVLLIDDDLEILHGASLRLEAAGFSTILASDGEQGLRFAIEDQPEAVVLDVRMPCMDGLEILSKLREHKDTKEIPVIMLSGSVVNEQDALNAGARFFLTKPYSGTSLNQAVERATAEYKEVMASNV